MAVRLTTNKVLPMLRRGGREYAKACAQKTTTERLNNNPTGFRFYFSQLQIGHGLLVALHAPLKSLRLLLAVLIPQHSPHEVLRSDFLLSDRVWHRIQETLDSNSVVSGLGDGIGSPMNAGWMRAHGSGFCL